MTGEGVRGGPCLAEPSALDEGGGASPASIARAAAASTAEATAEEAAAKSEEAALFEFEPLFAPPPSNLGLPKPIMPEFCGSLLPLEEDEGALLPLLLPKPCIRVDEETPSVAAGGGAAATTEYRASRASFAAARTFAFSASPRRGSGVPLKAVSSLRNKGEERERER